MSDTRETLGRGLGDFSPQPDAYGRVLERRRRKDRNRRVAAFAVVALIALAGALAVADEFSAEPSPYDQIPSPGRSSNGAVVFSASSLGALGADGILSSKDVNSPRDLFLSTPGVKPVRIIGAPGDVVDEACPTFSPDGTKLAYVERKRAGGSLAVVDIGGDAMPTGSPTTIFSGTDVSCPRWDPTGERIAIADQDAVEVVGLDGGWRSTGANVQTFSWSPDGSAIALLYADVWSPRAGRTAVRAPSRLEIMDLNSWSTEVAWTGELDQEPTSVVWAPDGSQLAVAGTRRLEERNQCCGGNAPFLDMVWRDDYSKTSLPVEGDPTGDWVDDIAWLSDGRVFVSLHASDTTLIVDPLGAAPTRSIDGSGLVSPDQGWFIHLTSKDGIRFAIVAEPIGGGESVYYSPWTPGLYRNEGDISWQAVPAPA